MQHDTLRFALAWCHASETRHLLILISCANREFSLTNYLVEINQRNVHQIEEHHEYTLIKSAIIIRTLTLSPIEPKLTYDYD